MQGTVQWAVVSFEMRGRYWFHPINLSLVTQGEIPGMALSQSFAIERSIASYGPFLRPPVQGSALAQSGEHMNGEERSLSTS
ncbi:hypothetical protein CISG_07398 [Coccidioides immitis RMSCC 3703]|uniref:Uncharacterized protein n=2 Tax=Coccidioides immitis TaxID=5501 RepID=A0A0J8R2B1_COCIT|nr:hypothetical protein CIRG_03851 [Coccidioides immitis RMSCC 2394]KMU78881.1 hypothetical protein CISG_07398 [Coccidioides immitis RMSCC 3703]